MRYEFDDEGNIYRIGAAISHIGERQSYYGFSFGYGLLGLIAYGALGFAIGILVLGFVSEELLMPVLIASASAGGVLGFILNGLGKCREVFSIHRSFIGLICGIIKGFGWCLYLVLNGGCFTIIIALVLSPLVTAVAAVIIVFFGVKGFIVLGRGGKWENI